jgi:hypothetical protein
MTWLTHLPLRGVWLAVLLAACVMPVTQPLPAPTAEIPLAPTADPHLANPAAVYCSEHGYRSEIRTAADGSQSGVCIFPDGAECDEWAFFRGSCGPAAPTPVPVNPLPEPTDLLIDPDAGKGWWTYWHPVYAFTVLLPPSWAVDEINLPDPALAGHFLRLHPLAEAETQSIRLSVRRVGEDVLLWPAGVGQGEFLAQGTLEIAGQSVQRMLLVCPTGEVTAIWYHGSETAPDIVRQGLEFGLIFSASQTHCTSGVSLSGDAQRLGETIIASLALTD